MGDAGELARRAYEAFAARDRKTLIDLSHPEIEIHTVTGQLAGREGPYRGHEGIDEYLADVDATWDEIKLRPHQFVELSGERLLVLGRARARRGTTHIDVPNTWLWEIEDGRVKLVRLFVDADSIQAMLEERIDAPAV